MRFRNSKGGKPSNISRLHQTAANQRRRQNRSTLRRLVVELLETRRMLAADWQNPLMPTDVDDDGFVSPLDVLRVINDLNLNGPRPLNVPFDNASLTAAYFDVDGNETIDPLDALIIVNRLNLQPTTRDLDLALANDSGDSANDLLTNDASVQGQLAASDATLTSARARWNRGVVFDLPVDNTGHFNLDSAALPNFTDGNIQFTIYVTDSSGADALRRLRFQLDTTPPAVLFNLAPTSDSGQIGDLETEFARITITGNTEAGASLKLVQTDASALVSNRGDFFFPNVPLVPNSNLVTLRARDHAGNEGDTDRTFTRLVAGISDDPVIDWNHQTLESIRLDATTPPEASRTLAIVHSAILDAVNSIDGTPGHFVSLPTTAGTSAVAAVAAAAHRVLSHEFPAQQAALDAKLAESLMPIPAGLGKTDGVALGIAIADAILALRENDGSDAYAEYFGSNTAGGWQPTSPMFDVALLPKWGELQTFAVSDVSSILPDGPPSLSSLEWASALNEVKSLGAASSSARTAEQTATAKFWADGKGTYSPPGHWNQIAEIVSQSQGSSLADNARIFAQLNLGLADAAILAWKVKYASGLWRPIAAIQQANSDGNDLTTADPNWTPLLLTPPFPEYVSGHSAFSGAAATILNNVFGNTVGFSVGSFTTANLVRSFTSFDAAAAEASFSRILGGIHYRFSGEDGLALGKRVGQQVLTAFSSSQDNQPPTIVLDKLPTVIGHNIELHGQILDNLAGLQQTSLQINGGAFTPLSLDSNGRFTLTNSLPTNGTADGKNVYRFRAIDAANNTTTREFVFTLDTQAPILSITSPDNNAILVDNSRLTGTAYGTGSQIVRLTYAFDAGSEMPVSFSSDNPFDNSFGSSFDKSFDTVLDISRLSVGPHTLLVRTMDAAGNASQTTRQLTLTLLPQFAITRFTPTDGSQDVGSTFKPQVFFSRPVDPLSLNGNNFYATDISGVKIPAKIVPSRDGSFAWLFFTNPMPGASTITVHIDGKTILAATGGQPLDADGNGAAGGAMTYQFTTVSLTPLLGTTLSGKVVDPGPDTFPMSFDDIQAGADGILHTPDDTFLNPIAGVKVFILGLEAQFAITDVNGNFHFDSVPAGNVKLAIDGRSATNAPAGFYFPEMVMNLQLEAGQANTVMGTMGSREEQKANRDRQELYLPRLQTSLLQNVTNNVVSEIGVNATSAPNLTPAQRSRLSISVQPGSFLDQNGNPLAAGQVGISTVPPELVRDMLPPGLLQHTFDITVQAPGITNFATPAPMTFPNLFGALPGSQLSFLSFDHTTGRLVIEGSATVSADGLSVSTDPGTGITHPGWHGLTPQGSPTSPDPNDDVADLGTEFEYTIKTEVVSDRPAAPAPAARAALRGATKVTDYLLTDSTERIRFSVKNDTNPKKSDGSYLRVEFTIDPTIAHQYLDGLTQTTFILLPTGSAKFDFTIKAPNILKLENDVLIGVKYHLEVTNVSKTGVETSLNESGDYYAYRYVDAMDDNAADGNLRFAPTLNDGTNGHVRTRQVEHRGEAATLEYVPVDPANPQYRVEFESNAKITRSILIFDPTQTAQDRLGTLAIKTRGDNPRTVTRSNSLNPFLSLIGSGVAPKDLYFNLPGLENELKRLADELVNGHTTQQVELAYIAGPGVNNSMMKFKLDYGPPTLTSELSMASTGGQVQTALERVTGGPGSVTVSASDDREIVSTGPNAGKTRILRRYLITIPLQNSVPVKLPLKLDVIHTGGNFGDRIDWNVNDFTSRISPNELAFIDTDSKRREFADLAMQAFEKTFKPFVDRGEIVIHAEGLVGADYNVNWTSTATDLFGLDVGVSVGYEKLEELVRTRTKFNPAQQSFLLAEARDIKHNGQNGGKTGVEVYVDEHFETAYPFWDAPFDIVTQELGYTAAHELGHALGLPHSSKVSVTNPVDELQKLVLTDGAPDDTFVLNFAGELTAPIRLRDASGLAVRQALQRLPTFRNFAGQVYVGGPEGGPFEIEFVDLSVGREQQILHGFSLPLLTGSGTGNLKVSASRTVPGGFGRKVDFSVITYPDSSGIGQSSAYDIMNSGNSGVPVTFQENVSAAGLRFGVRGDWTVDDARAFISFLVKAGRSGRKLEFSRDEPFEEGQEPLDPYDFTISGGPLLELFDGGSQLIPDVTNFGSASTVSPSVRHFSLVNLGSENATIRSVRIVKGIDFSTPTLPVTVLAPGKSLEFDVTFAPDSILTYEGTLSIDSDVEGFRGTYDLLGDGKPTNTPAIKLVFYNNLGSVPVGQLEGFTAVGSDSHGKLTNVGTAPLTITEFRVAAGQGFGEWMTPPLTQPITLAPGETTGIPFSFRPSKAGLRPGAFEVVSNDPRTPVLRVPVVATGVNIIGVISNLEFIYADLDVGNDYVAIDDNNSYTNNMPELRTKSDKAGHWEFFLPAKAGVRVTTFDPVSGLIAYTAMYTNEAGVSTLVNSVRRNFNPSDAPDTDGDGLPDDVEFAIGTNPNQLDTDGDGTNDFAELDTGSNPLDDRPSANGIVSALQTGNIALDIKLVADFLDPSRSLAYIASGNSGLTVVDVTDFAKPISISQFTVPGLINNLSLDVGRKIVAAASPTSGVHLIDVANPTQPKLLRTLPHEGTDPVAAVELYDGLVYVGVGGKIRAFDVQSGELSSDFDLGTQLVLGMSRNADRLYATLLDTVSNQRLLRIFEIASAGLAASGSLVLPGITTAGDPYVTNDIKRFKNIVKQTPAGPIIETIEFRTDVVWIPAGDRVITVDVANPLSPEIITSTATIAQGGAADIELNGSGLGVVAGFVNPGGSAIVLQTPDANSTNQIFTRFALPTFGQAVALNSGLAYIADGTSGLQLVNFLQRDTGRRPPTVGLNPLANDINPGQPGVQLFEGSTVTLGNQITDDVQVRKVELLIDGTVVRTELSYPYDLTTVLPTIAQTGNQAVLQVRATDTGGNSTLSDPIVIDLLADVTGPTIRTLDPASGSTQPLSRRKVSITFSEALDRSTMVLANYDLQGPGGPITPISIDLRQRDTQVEILYPPLAKGAYTFVTHAAVVKDRAGNALGAADVSSTFTVAPAVFVPTIRWVNDAGGLWSSASNWRDVVSNQPRVPIATDDVMIDVPTDAQITLDAGVITVNSVISNERFQITGGRLNVTDTIQINNTFLINGVNENNIATFSGTVLRGSGGQSVDVAGDVRLIGATIQTDIRAASNPNILSRLRLAGGFALQGTYTTTNTATIIGIEGSQTISSGTFVTTGATPNAALIRIESVGASTLTFGEGVTFQAQLLIAGGSFYTTPSGPNRLSLINRGTITALGSPTAFFGVFTETESFTNYGTINTQDRGTVSIKDKTFTNTATGRITISIGQYQGFIQAKIGGSTTTSVTNAGTIEFVNARADILSGVDGVNHVFSNTGTIIVNKAEVFLNGSFTSDDVVNIRNTGYFLTVGVMDNTGRTFTYSNTAGAFFMGGRILGGAIVKAGPAKLFLGGTIVGVTLDGDFNFGELFTDPLYGSAYYRPGRVNVEQGLTLRGTISIYSGPSAVNFVGGPQTVSGGTIQSFVGNQTQGSAIISAFQGGPVVFDSTVTIRSNNGASIQGNIISYANIILDANTGLFLSGIKGSINSNFDGPFVNRGTITVPTTRTLNLGLPFINEGRIIVSGGTVKTQTPSNSLVYVDSFSNTGTINLTGGGLLRLTSDQPSTLYHTADLGTIIDSGGFVQIEDGVLLDNSGATLQIDGTANWSLIGRNAVIVGGTIQVDSTAKFEAYQAAVLKDVIVNGNSSRFGPSLVGNVVINGTVTGDLQFGHPLLYPGIPLVIRGGQFNVGYATLTGYSTVPTITFESDVVLKGNRTNATFNRPVTNRGQIIADGQNLFLDADRLFHFTVAPFTNEAAPITNEGTLSAINRGILRIDNLAVPNSGIVSAGVGSSVEFTSTFSQASTGATRMDIAGTAATQFGLVAVTGAATLAGTLDIRFTSGYAPAVGDRFKVMTYASKTGQFSTINVTGLATGFVVTPEYNGTDLTLVVKAVP